MMSVSHAVARCQVWFCGPTVGTAFIDACGLCYLEGQEDVCVLFCMWKPIIYAPTKCNSKETTFCNDIDDYKYTVEKKGHERLE